MQVFGRITLESCLALRTRVIPCLAVRTVIWHVLEQTVVTTIDDEGLVASKVGRGLIKYDLVELADELAARWTVEGDERWGLRKLADWLNKQFLRAALTEADQSVSAADLETIYQQLTADDVSQGTQTERRNELERAGVPIEQVERDFVSYQAIHTFLTEVADLEYEGPSDAERVASVRKTLTALRGRVIRVLETNFEAQRQADRLTLGEFDAGCDIYVTCYECGERYDAIDLIDRGGCDCGSLEPDEATAETTD